MEKKQTKRFDKPSLLYYLIISFLPLEIMLLIVCLLAIIATNANVDLYATVMAILLLVLSYTGVTFSGYYLTVSSYREKSIRIIRVVHGIFCVLMMGCCVLGCL
ncbi:hypothetical protein P261_00464 [Lachnospiraceae bacterium TWA4]|nr:hypothetical protein P261_00464 [Lachnospiraceae bacterium TWA4]